MFDAEGGVAAGGVAPMTSRFANLRTGRTSFHLPKEFREGISGPFGVRSDRPVGKVGYVPHQPQTPRRVMREIPETDALDAAQDPNLQ